MKFSAAMLKLGTIRFQSRCDRHPMYNPVDGQAAIRGGCQRCNLLLDIYETHLRLVELIRKTRNDAVAGAKRAAAAEGAIINPRQGALF